MKPLSPTAHIYLALFHRFGRRPSPYELIAWWKERGIVVGVNEAFRHLKCWDNYFGRKTDVRVQ